MTQQPFNRPGAIDLSALRQPAASTGGAPAGPGGSAGSYALDVDEQSFQQVLEASMKAPVVLVLYSPSQSPDSVGLANDLTTIATESEGRFLLGRVNADLAPGIAQAMQVPVLPLVALVAQGRPMPLFDRVVPMDQLRPALDQVFQQLATQGFSGRHQPLSGAVSPGEEGEEPQSDPRYAAAEDALAASDYDAAVAEYQKLLDANPADAEASAGLAMAKVLQRVQGVDLQAARQAAADNPDDVAAQTLVADLDLYGGHVEDSFARLVELVRRTGGDDREAARTHLIGLFAAVGNDDERVLVARRNLASALF